ncbi:MAG: tetratricopeptide repeat protein [Betaproteobacteria bacterium]|nr:tetratricopeptide repeat protein [Betaproteobacteria bacterium]
MRPEQQALAIPQAMRTGWEHHGAGRLQEAERTCQSVLQVDPNHPDALNLLGVIANQSGKGELAVELIEQAIRQQPMNPNFLSNLGVAQYGLRRLQEALACYDKALAIKHDHVGALSNRGNTLQQLQRYDEAIASYREALSLKPDHAVAQNNLGNALRNQGRLAEAIASYRKALSFKPEFTEAYRNLGAALKDQGRLEEAIASYRQALSFKPDDAEAHHSLGAALKDQGRLGEAIASYQVALSLKPEYAEVHNDLGVALKDQDKLEEAIASYRRALSIRPELAQVHVNLGTALKAQGRREEAMASYDKAISLSPGFVEARWASTVSRIPVSYGPGDSHSDGRAEFAAALSELDAWFCGERVREGYKAVGIQQPFHLAYQEEDNRDLLSRYGALCFRLMSDWSRRQEPGATGTASRRMIGIGIVSSHLYNHSVWHALLEGWLQNLDRSRFGLHLFSLGSIHDDKTSFARSNASTFSQAAGGLKQWVAAIRAQPLDALIYPEIGMDAMTTRLASMRLAPVQLCAWGHPQTTGLPSVDYFLSAQDFEPDHADAHYTERLIRLPHLGCCYPFVPVVPATPDLDALAIDGTLPLLICPGAPFKYAPQQDRVFVEIARKLGRCQLIFFRGHLKEQTEILQRRLGSAFAQAGLRYDDFVVSIPWQPKPAFYGLMQRADAYLDTIGFSGFNTAMQAVECALPIVAREGKFMRGRLASGILKRMGLPELVAPTDEAYIDLVAKLAKDPEYRQRMKERMRRSRNILFNDLAPIKALEDLLINVTGRR